MLLGLGEPFLRDLLPGGKRLGHEYVCGSLQGGEGRSCSVNLNTGVFADFSTGEKGKDLVALYALVHGLNNGQAAKQIQGQYGGGTLPPPRQRSARSNGNGTGAAPAPAKVKKCIIVPEGTPPPDFYHPSHGHATKSWRYLDAQGRTLQYVARYDPPNDRKQYCPWTYDGQRWNKYGWPDPQPLYGLDDLALRPDATVIMVEGEASKDAAARLFPRQVVVSCCGGSNRWHKNDLGPLHGKRVIFWPDADKAGIEYARGIGSALFNVCPDLKIFDVQDKPAGWDAADALKEGWTPTSAGDWGKAHISDLPRLNMVSNQPFKPQANVPTRHPGVVEPGSEALAGIADPYVLWSSWNLQCNGGGPYSNINNVVNVLEKDPKLANLVWYDEFLQKLMTGSKDGAPREWADVDDVHLVVYVQRELDIPKMGLDSVRSAIQEYAMRHRRHCVRDWMDSLVWDGTPRIDHVFEDHFGAEATPYIRAASKNFWISMCARIYRPGCKVDNMIVFEGEQGIRKSLALQIIGAQYWTEQHANVIDKSFFEVMQGKMMIEVGEMDAFTRADITKVKQVVTCPTDRYREPYERYAADHPRQCIFVGNTNRDDWNKDETGARRFWPVKCGSRIDVDALAHNRDQYFAEAVHRLNPKGDWDAKKWHFTGGEDWWSMPDDETTAQQRERLQEDPWQEFVEKHISWEKVGDSYQKRITPLSQVTINEILIKVLGVEVARIQRADERRIGACLTALGWRKRSGRFNDDDGNPVFGKVWRPKMAWEQ